MNLNLSVWRDDPIVRRIETLMMMIMMTIMIMMTMMMVIMITMTC